MKKRILLIGLIVVLVCGLLTGCDLFAKEPAGTPAPVQTATTAPTETVTQAPEATAGPTAETTAAQTVTGAPSAVVTPGATGQMTKAPVVTPGAVVTQAPTQKVTATPAPTQKATPKPTKKPTQAPTKKPTTKPASTAGSEYAHEVLRLVNIEREKEGLAPLQNADQNLYNAATLRAKEIQELFEHERPSGQQWHTAIDEFGVSYRVCGENIAVGHKSPEEVVQAWMNSEGHRANILFEHFTHLAVGVEEKDNRLHWCQLFIGVQE